MREKSSHVISVVDADDDTPSSSLCKNASVQRFTHAKSDGFIFVSSFVFIANKDEDFNVVVVFCAADENISPTLLGNKRRARWFMKRIWYALFT